MTTRHATSNVGVRPPDDVAAVLRTLLSGPDFLSMEVMFGLRASVQALENAIQRLRSPDELSMSRMHVIMLLWAANKPVPHMHLVRAMKVSRATVSGLVDGLLEAGFVTAAVDCEDKRNVLLTLTPAGRTAARTALKRNAAQLSRAFSRLSATELGALVALLGQLQNSMAYEATTGAALPSL